MPHSQSALADIDEARHEGLLTIGQAAARSGVSAKMIRHYEGIELLPSPRRTFSNYRLYSATDVHTLAFIRRGRDLGFSLAEVKDLLTLWQDRGRKSSEVRRIAQAHVRDLDERIARLQGMRRTLEHLAGACRGDERPDCPILEDLAHAQL